MAGTSNIVSVFISDVRTYTYYGKFKTSDGHESTHKVVLVLTERKNGALSITPYIDGYIQNTETTVPLDTTVSSNWDKTAQTMAKKVFGKEAFKLQGVIEDFIAVDVPFNSSHKFGIRFLNTQNSGNNVVAQLSDYRNGMYPDAPMKTYGVQNFTISNRKGMYAFVKREMTEVLLSEIYNNEPNSPAWDRRKLVIQGLASCCKNPIKFNFIKYVDL